MSIIALVACSSKKAGRPSPARDLYVSDLFKKSSAFASRIADRWYILSAKHGLLDPHDIIGPYDVTLNKMNKEQRADWAVRVTVQLLSVSESSDEIVILAGKKYSENLISKLSKRGNRVSEPLSGKGIGQRLAWLKRQLE